jgi:aryl-alcohol dehydrogenase-like predicted oxidoreductase
MTDLPRRVLGHTGVSVSVLGYGSMDLRGQPRGRELDEVHVAALLNEVLDAGVDLIDTSIDYGIAEERIGRHIAHRRDEYVLAGKCGCLVGWEAATADERSPHDFGRANLVAGVEQSLRRLQTDHLDLLQVHASPSRATLEAYGVVETLVELRDRGLTRFIGMSGTLPHLSDHLAMGVFDVVQVPYSALQRAHGPLITAASEAGSGVIVRGGAGKGTPSGGARPVGRHGALAQAWRRARLDDLLDGTDPVAFVLRYTISHPGMTSTIVGTASIEHLTANVAAVAAGPLPADVHAEATRRLEAADAATAG